MLGARRKFFDLHIDNKSPIAVEREGRELDGKARAVLRQDRSRPLLADLYQWLATTRKTVTAGSGTARAMDYTLKRWPALERTTGSVGNAGLNVRMNARN